MSDTNGISETPGTEVEPTGAAVPAETAETAEAGAEAAAAEPGPISRRNGRKVREGVVMSAAMQKTVVVRVIDRVRHSRYAKTVQRTKRLYVHDEADDARVGDRVRVQETRPLSRHKRWRLVEVLERAK